MRRPNQLQTILVGTAAVLVVSARFVRGEDGPGPLSLATASVLTPDPLAAISTSTRAIAANVATASSRTGNVAAAVTAALTALAGSVRQLSTPQALDDAFHAYFAFKTAHPDQVRKPYLYFVDYGLPSTTARGYVFDMDALRVIDGPFTVAHGRGSSDSQYGVPTHFSNADGSNATSLGLYVAEELYAFHGNSGGHRYSSIGMRLMGVSTGYNDLAYSRRVVAHGAPYVTPTRAGRSEGCPAMEPARAQRLLPRLAGGGMVFLFAPDTAWMAGDPWVAAAE